MIQTLASSSRRGLKSLTLAGAAVIAAGCASVPTPTAPSGTTALPQAVAAATDHVLGQIAQKRSMPMFLAEAYPDVVYVSPVVDALSRQQTQATVSARNLIVGQFDGKKHADFKVTPQTTEGSATTEFRLDSSMAPVVDAAGQRQKGRYTLEMRVVKVEDGTQVAQSTAEIDDAALDGTPTVFYQDAPVTMTKDAPPAEGKVTERDRTRAMARMDEANAAYDAKKYEEALAMYRAAAEIPGVDMMPALVGAYLATTRLGREDEAQAAFAKIVSHGLKSKALGVKLLFAPGKTEFWPDPAISKPYPGWLAEIARQAGEGKDCMQVVGHSSHTGSEDFNLTLSQKRAVAIRGMLQASNAGLEPRLSTAGVGWRENLAGTGTDDLQDAVDRRVEFKSVNCP